jgi:hypothetical protein
MYMERIACEFNFSNESGAAVAFPGSGAISRREEIVSIGGAQSVSAPLDSIFSTQFAFLLSFSGNVGRAAHKAGLDRAVRPNNAKRVHGACYLVPFVPRGAASN